LLKLKVEVGALRALWTGELAAVKGGVKRAIAGATVELQAQLRAETQAAGLGQGIANAWRLRVYPEARDSTNAAGLVWSRAPRVIDAANRGAVITGKTGNWLAIPLPAAGKAYRGKRITPLEWERQRNLKLRYVYLRGRNKALLVADVVRIDRRGIARRRQYRHRGSGEFYTPLHGATSAAIFLLVPAVRMRKLLDLQTAANAAAASAAARITRELG
jgi:hypothetical protein